MRWTLQDPNSGNLDCPKGLKFWNDVGSIHGAKGLTRSYEDSAMFGNATSERLRVKYDFP
jgi:hypothetical protein